MRYCNSILPTWPMQPAPRFLFAFALPASILIATLLPLALTESVLAAIGDETFKLVADDNITTGGVGVGVAINDNTAVVGAYADDDNGSLSGSAYVFNVDTGDQILKLLPNDGASDDVFGWSVGVSGNKAIVGAWGANPRGPNSGAAYLFDVTTGVQTFKLVPGDGQAVDSFGQSVAIDGNIAVIGALQDDDRGSDAGSAYLFDVTTGLQTRKLLASDGAPADLFGRSVAISGNTTIVGAELDNDRGTDSGSAYLFDVTTGAQLLKLLASDGAAGDSFGYTTAISGNLAIVGAPLDDHNGIDTGSAYVFDVTTGAQLFKLLASDGAAGDSFGYSVGISGNLAVISARYDDDNGQNTGSAYLFDIATGRELAKLVASDGAAQNYFGTFAAISGYTAIVGAPNNGAAGAAYLFTAIPEPTTALLLFTAGLSVLCGRPSRY